MRKLYESIMKNLSIEENTGDYYLYYEPMQGKPLYLSGDNLVEDIARASRFPIESEAEEKKKEFEEETGKKLILTQFRDSDESIRR